MSLVKSNPKPSLASNPAFRPVEFDHMPTQVATELLASSFRITNRLRKECHAARAKLFTSKLEAKALDTKIESRLQRATISQLAKWLKRTIERRAECQRAYLRAGRIKQTTPLVERLMASLDLKAGQLDFVRDKIEGELERRQEGIKAKALEAERIENQLFD